MHISLNRPDDLPKGCKYVTLPASSDALAYVVNDTDFQLDPPIALAPWGVEVGVSRCLSKRLLQCDGVQEISTALQFSAGRNLGEKMFANKRIKFTVKIITE